MRSRAYESVVDGGWVAVARFNGEVEVWRGGVFDDEAEAIEAFRIHADEVGRADHLKFEFLHAVRVEVDADGMPELHAPALREYLPDPVAPPAFYVIGSTTNSSDSWSNDDGWTDGPGFTVFTADERRSADLPIGGEWIAITLIPA